MKTRSLILTILAATLILWAISIPFMTSAKVVINALPTTTLYLSPFNVQGSAGSMVAVDLKISNVINLFAFQAGFLFNPTTVSIASYNVTEGGFLSNSGADTLLAFPGSPDNVHGYVSSYGWTLLDPTLAKNGSGTLMHAIFKMKTAGFSDIHIIELKLVLNDGSTLIPAKTIDYYTTVVGGNQYITKVVGNAYGYSPSDPHSSGYANYTFAYVTKSILGTPYHGELNFTVTSFGVGDDLFGYFNATIPKKLMNCTTLDDWRVALDGNLQSSRTLTENATYTTLSLEWTYAGGLQRISINSINGAVPEFPTMFLAPLLVLATLAAAILGKSTWTYRRKT